MSEIIRDTDTHVYNVHDLIGRGATGEVYKGINKKTGELVALKMFDHRFSPSVQREVDALVKLNHQNIVTFYRCEKDYDSKRVVLVMELCEKGSLLDLLREPENAFGLEEEEFLKVFQHLVAGIKHLREVGFSHRDIKPGNILIFTDEDGSNVYKLSDFGTAKPLGDKDLFKSLVGTEEYLHPDIFHAAFIEPTTSAREFSISADLWSLGITLFHSATGSVPFHAYKGRFDRQTMYSILSKKSKGVLAGQQLIDGGPIIWKTELPKTCCLTRPLRSYITSILVNIFDGGFEFDQFFDQADVMVHPRIKHIHIFSTLSGQFYRLFLDKDARWETFSTEIHKILGVEKSKQIFFHEHDDVLAVIKPDTPVAFYPHTSKTEPFVLITNEKKAHTCETETDHLVRYDKCLPEPVNFDVVGNTEADYKVAKKIFQRVHLHKRMVHLAVSSQRLHSCTISRHGRRCYEKIKTLQSHFTNLQERFKDVESLSSAEWKAGTQHFARVSMNGDVVEDNFESVNNRIQEAFKGLSALKDEYDAAHEAWEIQQSTVLKNQQWEGQADRLVDLANKRMQKFIDYRTKSRLSYHEKQLFTFDRNAMQDLLTKSKSVFDDCYDSLKDTHLKFLVWRSHYTQFSDTINTMREKMEGIQGSIRELVETMKGIPEPPPKFIKQKLLMQDVKQRMDVVQESLTENKTEATKARDQIEIFSQLIKDLPVPTLEDCDGI